MIDANEDHLSGTTWPKGRWGSGHTGKGGTSVHKLRVSPWALWRPPSWEERQTAAALKSGMLMAIF